MTKTTTELNPSRITKLGNVLLNTFTGFFDDECYARASALTFYTLFSIVPLVAVAFGIGKGFGFEKNIEQELTKAFADQPQVAEKVMTFARSWLENAQGGLIAGAGIFLLLWSVVSLLSSIESALNKIWKVQTSRSLYRSITDYITLIIVAPAFFIASSSITIFLTTQITETVQHYSILEAISPFLLSLLKLSPYILSSILFTFAYMFIPNTKVYFKSALIAGIVGGILFQFWQWVYIKFQVVVTSYGAIYGSFAALPLFLIWVQVSWMILLAAAELAVQLENYFFIPNRLLSLTSQKEIALYITHECMEAFYKGMAPVTNRQLSLKTCLSLNNLRGIIAALIDGRIISEVVSGGYQPARPLNMITMQTVSEAIDSHSSFLAALPDDETTKHIREYLQKAKVLNEKLSHEFPTLDRDSKGIFNL